jgi:hypothetical protein
MHGLSGFSERFLKNDSANSNARIGVRIYTGCRKAATQKQVRINA